MVATTRAVYLTYEKTITAYREAGANAAAGPAAISCTLAATFPLLVQTFGPYNPFYMGVGGIARITCTAPVTQLSLVAIVDWDGVPLTGPPVQTPGNVVGSRIPPDARARAGSRLITGVGN